MSNQENSDSNAFARYQRLHESAHRRSRPGGLSAAINPGTALALASEFLLMASDRFGRNTCNDFHLSRVVPDVDQRRMLMKAYHEWNGDPEEYNLFETYDIVSDAALMRFLGEWLKP